MATGGRRSILVFAAVSVVVGAIATEAASLAYYVNGETCVDGVFFFVGVVCTVRWAGPTGWRLTPIDSGDVLVGTVAAVATLLLLVAARHIWGSPER